MAREHAATPATTASPLVLCQQLLAAVDRLDAAGIRLVLDLSVAAHGLPTTVDDVLLPSMREVGVRWSRGRCDVEQEHLATDTVLIWLESVATPAPRLDHGPIVLSGGPLDHHTISLEAFAVLLRQKDFDCRNLRGPTPAAALRGVAEQCHARAVVLVCQLPRNRPAAIAALHGLTGTGAALFYAGAAFRTSASRQKLPGHYLGGNLSRAADHVAGAVRPT